MTNLDNQISITREGRNNGNSKKPKTERRWTWKKPKGKPCRPLSAYNLFFKDVRKEVLEEMKTAGGFRNLARTVSLKWKNIDPTLKAKYESKATEERRKYKTVLAQWQEQQKLMPMKSTNSCKSQNSFSMDDSKKPKLPANIKITLVPPPNQYNHDSETLSPSQLVGVDEYKKSVVAVNNSSRENSLNGSSRSFHSSSRRSSVGSLNSQRQVSSPNYNTADTGGCNNGNVNGQQRKQCPTSSNSPSTSLVNGSTNNVSMLLQMMAQQQNGHQVVNTVDNDSSSNIQYPVAAVSPLQDPFTQNQFVGNLQQQQGQHQGQFQSSNCSNWMGFPGNTSNCCNDFFTGFQAGQQQLQGGQQQLQQHYNQWQRQQLQQLQQQQLQYRQSLQNTSQAVFCAAQQQNITAQQQSLIHLPAVNPHSRKVSISTIYSQQQQEQQSGVNGKSNNRKLEDDDDGYSSDGDASVDSLVYVLDIHDLSLLMEED